MPHQIDDKRLLIQTHPCTRGLDDAAVGEIADAGELVRCRPGDVVHHANEVVTSVSLVIQGRLASTLLDPRGKVMLRRFHTTGGQFGLLSAAAGEPTPIDCVAEDPTTLIRFDYGTLRTLARANPTFGLNLTQAMATSVGQMLLNDRRPVRPPLVAFFHESADTRVVSRKLLERLVSLGETPCVMTDLSDWSPPEGVRCRALVEDGRLLPPDELRQQINEWMVSHRVFGDIGTNFDHAFVANTVELCEQVLWFVTPENHEASVARLQEIEAQAPGLRDKVTIVWLLDGPAPAPVAPALRQLAKRDIKITFREPVMPDSRVLINGFDRLVHLVRGVRIGVALGGGGARGMAHLGVLKTLEREGIVVDMIAGTSAGAMVGTLHAAGMDMDYAARQFAHDLTPSWLFRHMPSGEQWYLLYKYRRRQFDPMLRRYIGDVRLEQLSVPMSTVSVDLISGQSIVRDAGDAVHGIIESINLPVLSPPVNRHGQALVDGGLINNIPADVLVAQGCNFVIAVTVTAQLEHEFAGNRPDTPTREMKRGSAIQTLLRSQLVQSGNLNSIGIEPADAVIAPDVTGFDLSAFTRTAELAAVGEQTTLESIAEIKSALARLDGELFGAGPG